MEQLVLGIFQEQLGKVIIGFRKEQVNANLLNGKGEIKDVSLNCNVLNAPFARVCPIVRMEEIHVSRIGFHVTSWTNLRKAPIIVDIGQITAKAEEPFELLPRHERERIQMVTEEELIKMLSEGFKPVRGSGSYGLVDRIVDNMTIEIESFKLEFQTWGKFKTKRPGPWTPPLLQVALSNLKISMVDAEGNESNPDQVWAHNRKRRESLLTFKKVNGECKLNLIPQDGSSNEKQEGDSQHELAKLKMEVQIAIERRIRDGAILACQFDVTIPELDVDIDSRDIRSMAHLISGIQYCLAKDKSFEDPLKSLAESKLIPSSSSSPVALDLVDQGDSVEESEGIEIGEDDNDVTEIMNGSSAANTDDDGGSIQDDGSITSLNSDDRSAEDEDSSKGTNTAGKTLKNKSKAGRAIVILPGNVIIYKSICFTFSIHNLTVRGSYPGDKEKGCLELVAKGCVAELIWPKVDREHGCYLQLSTSFVSLQERIGHRKRMLLLAGIQRDDPISLRLPSRKPRQIKADEYFPLFEQRGIRDDPLDLRHLFPTQAFGLKTTIDVLEKPKDDEIDIRFMVLHEIGAGEIDVVLDTKIFLRVTRFILDMDGEGFDPRWDTGDWSDLLTPDMLRLPSETIDLDDHLQECAELFLDENLMISSDLLKVTARLSNIEVRIPSAVEDSLRSCDIIMKWAETTFVISSALPRTFLTGRIGNSINGDARRDNEKGVIDFPNDPSDVCYKSEEALTGTTISTFRLQLTTRGFEVNTVPIIPFCTAPESQKIIAIGESTSIFCFEGEPPVEGCNKMKITVFLSTLIQELILNIDVDILAGATCTLLHHKENILAIIESLSAVLTQLQNVAPISSETDLSQPSDTSRIKQGLKGRRILARRHMSQSRETGGLVVIFCLQQKDFRLRVWRQNVPLSSPLRNGFPSNVANHKHNDGFIKVLNILDCAMKDLEVGIEFDFHSNSGHRTVIKSFLKGATLKVVDLAKEIEEHKTFYQGSSSKNHAGSEEKTTKWNLTNLCSFGNESLPCGLNPSGVAQQFAFRLEGHHKNNFQSWSIAADISAPSTINLDADAVKASTLLVIEALLLPAWSKNITSTSDPHNFPPGTVGEMFSSVVAELIGDQDFVLLDLGSLEIETNSGDPIVDGMLRSICKKMLPPNLQVILLRCEIANLLISIPSERNDETKKNNISFLLNQSDIISRFYPVPGSPPSEIEQVLACKGTDWSTLINTNKEGFYLHTFSRQSLLSMTEEQNGTKLDTVIHPFEISLTYSGAEVKLSMEEGISIDDIRLIEKIQSRLKSAVKLSSEYLFEILSVVGAMMHRGPTEISIPKLHNEKPEEKKSGEETILKEYSSSLHKIQTYLQSANEEFGRYENYNRDSMRKRDNELEAMQIDLFLKERERFGVLSLMSSRVAGWIKMGSQHRSGQRIVKKSLLWPFWAILRKELLILFPSPGKPKPSDIISLVNARIRKLAGGNSRQDTKRGFAIIESSGMIRYFVTGNAQEYELWTNQIHQAIMFFSSSTKLLNGGSFDDSKTLELSLAGTVNEKDSNVGGSQRNNGIGNRLSSAFQSARFKGRGLSMQSMDRSIHGDDSVTLSNSENIALKQNTENMDSTLLTGTENEKDTTVGGSQRNSGIGNRLSSAFRLKSRGLNTPSLDQSIHSDDSVTLSNSEINELKQNTENMDSTLLTGTENEKDTTVGGNQRNSGIGNRLSSAFRLKSRGLTTPSMDQSIHSDDSVTLSNLETNELKQNTEKMDSTLVTPKRAEASKELSGIGQVTKSRFGSAFQSARQKRNEITSKLMSNDNETEGDLQANHTNSEIDLNARLETPGDADPDESRGSVEPRTGLGNKLGSAIKSARTKTMGNNGNNEKQQSRLSSFRGRLGEFTQGLSEDIREVDSNPKNNVYNDESTATSANEVENDGSDRQASHSPNGNLTNIDPLQLSFSQGTANNAVDNGRTASNRDVEINRRSSRFNFLKRNEDPLDDSLFGGKTLPLRNIYAGQNFPSLPDSGPQKMIPLKILKEKWIIKVCESTKNVQNEAFTDTEELPVSRDTKDHKREATDSLVDVDNAIINSGMSSFQNEDNVSADLQIKDSENSQPGINNSSSASPNSIGAADVASIDHREAEEQLAHLEAQTQHQIRDVKKIESIRCSELHKDVARFFVKIFRLQGLQDEASSEKQLSYGDVLKLYSEVSEAIQEVLPQFLGNYSSVWDETSESFPGKSTFKALSEKMMLCGQTLGALLETRESFNHIEGFGRLQCESIENFLNSLVECPLPACVLTLLSETLGIDGKTEDFESTQDDSPEKPDATAPVDDLTEIEEHKNGRIAKHESCSTSIGSRPGDILNLLSACEAELQHAAIEGIQAAKHANMVPSIQFQPIFYEPLLPPSLTDHIHESFHEALTNVMTERDEAHAQLIGANVMHLNSLERIRKKNERLQIDAQLSQDIAQMQRNKDLQNNGIANMFGKPDVRIEKLRKEIDQRIEKVHNIIRNDDSDVEMMQLCTQLANEISNKSALMLEVERMKRVREKERNTESVEKEALKDELTRIKELLDAERKKNAKACTEAAHWKSLYEGNRANIDKA